MHTQRRHLLPTQHARLAGSGGRASPQRAPFECEPLLPPPDLRKVSVSILARPLLASYSPSMRRFNITGPRLLSPLSCLSMHLIFIGALPQMKKSTWNKWKNHFSEIKGDVGMSLHEKEGEQEDAYTETGSH